MEPSNIPITMIGVALLWFGWFGFNGGSALAANGLLASERDPRNQHVGSGRRADLDAAAAGRTAGRRRWASRAARSPAWLPSPRRRATSAILPAIVIGVVAGLLCYSSLVYRMKKGLDESLDAWSIHGMGGFWGVIATGIFAAAAINGYSGLLEGNVRPVLIPVAGGSRRHDILSRGHRSSSRRSSTDHRPAGPRRRGICRARHLPARRTGI